MDAGRGIAALCVLEHHVMVFFGDRARAALNPVVLYVAEFVAAQNAGAVQFFFFLSGWAIYLALDQSRDRCGKIDWRVFAWHRCRRILPLYWLALLLSLMLFVPAGVSANAVSVFNLGGNLAFLQTPESVAGWFTPYAANGPLWSLAYEAWYYAATPILCLPIFSKRSSSSARILLPFAIACGISFGAFLVIRLLFLPFISYAIMWPLWVAGFVFGASCTHRAVGEGFLLLLFAFCLAFLLGLHAYIRSDTLGSLENGFEAICIAVIIKIIVNFMSIVSLRHSIILRIADLFVFVGSGSYALYVLHYPILRWLWSEQAENHTVIVSIALMLVGMPLLEKRLNRLVKRISFPFGSAKGAQNGL